MANQQTAKKNLSFLRQLDPRVKLTGALSFSLAVAFLDQLPTLSFAFLCALALTLIARIPLRELIRRVLILNLFILFFWISLPFTIPGKILLASGPFIITQEGISYAGMLTLRSNAIILVIITLTATTPVTALVHALARMGISDKIVYLFFLTYRYSHEITKEYKRMQNALRIRCFQPKSSLLTYKTYAYVVGMLLVNSYERGRRIRAAMLCRGFQNKFHHLDTLCLKNCDIGALAVLLLCITGMIATNVKYYH